MNKVGDLLKIKGSKVLTTYEDNVIADAVAVVLAELEG